MVKPSKNLLLQNQKAGDLGDVGPTKLTLAYLTSRSNLLPNAFKWDFLEADFLNIVEAKVIILT